MKKIVLTLALLANVINSIAQVEVSTKSLDLKPLNKHKYWQFGETGIDAETGNIYVKMQQANCDKKNGLGTVSFKGSNWNVDKLIFDKDFNYKETKSFNYGSTAEALLNNENIFGKKYNAKALGSGSAAIIDMAKAATTAMPSGLIDNSFLFKTIVTVRGNSLVSSEIGICLNYGVDKNYGGYCFEDVCVYKGESKPLKEEKGQRWIAMMSHTVPDGGNIMYNTVGVIKEEKQHYIFRKYDKFLNIVKEVSFTFDYQCLLNGKHIEIAPGIFDYVFISTPINYKKSKMPLAPANNYEYFYVDGNTFEIKERLTISAPNSQWLFNHVMHKDGATYIVGACGPKNNVYADIFSFPKEADFLNIQVAKIKNGKLVYVSSSMNKELKSTFKTVEGLKGNSSINFSMPSASLDVSNDKLILSGQQEYGKKGALQTIIFDKNGKIESILSKQEKIIARSHISFSKDGKKLYWLLEDLGEYNKPVDVGGGVMVLNPNKAREAVSSLSIVTYDLVNNNITKFQNLENEDWALNYKNPILLDQDNTMILLGNKITRKARESELVFITIKK
ncbi:MAG: hypothetical protein Q8R57_07230 [Bacteroidota bacterium]|nr:hypothetical protein [Bacteroidota bacterium]